MGIFQSLKILVDVTGTRVKFALCHALQDTRQGSVSLIHQLYAHHQVYGQSQVAVIVCDVIIGCDVLVILDYCPQFTESMLGPGYDIYVGCPDMSLNSVCYLRCATRYIQTDIDHPVCQSDATWSNASGCISTCSTPLLPVLTTSVNMNSCTGNDPFGTRCEIRCITGTFAKCQKSSI